MTVVLRSFMPLCRRDKKAVEEAPGPGVCQLGNDRACDAIPGHCYCADWRKSLQQGVEGSCVSVGLVLDSDV